MAALQNEPETNRFSRGQSLTERHISFQFGRHGNFPRLVGRGFLDMADYKPMIRCPVKPSAAPPVAAPRLCGFFCFLLLVPRLTFAVGCYGFTIHPPHRKIIPGFPCAALLATYRPPPTAFRLVAIRSRRPSDVLRCQTRHSLPLKPF